MTDTELRRLAESARDANAHDSPRYFAAWNEYKFAASPDVVLGLLDRCERAEADAKKYRARKDEAYTERNRVVALLARLVLAAGGIAGKRKHEPEPDPSWDPEWLTLVAIDLPTGQVSWHFHDSDAHLVADLPEYPGSWDGHDTPEKYRRVLACDALPDDRIKALEVERDEAMRYFDTLAHAVRELQGAIDFGDSNERWRMIDRVNEAARKIVGDNQDRGEALRAHAAKGGE